MKFLSTGSELSQTLIRLCRESDTISMAVAWGTPSAAFDQLLEQKDKWQHVVVGTHFYQTPPYFLEKLLNAASARVMPPSGATFHPKIYKFSKGGMSTLIIGSANFTNAAFKTNTEACILIEGNIDEKIFLDADKFIRETCWDKAIDINSEFLKRYQTAFTENTENNRKQAENIPGKYLLPSTLDSISEMDWEQYVLAITNGNYYYDRINLIEQARSILSDRSFSDLSPLERKSIAGTISRTDENDVIWTLSGSMLGFGILRNLVSNAPQEISIALDCIPSNGQVNENDYDEFITRYQAAFNGRERTGSIASASRFLAMKRPDVFICVSNKNKHGLAKCFLSGNNITVDNYWKDLISKIRSTRWWNSDRPNDETSIIWDGRVAILDGIFYEE